MHSYNNLFKDFIARDNIEKAINKASKGKKDRKSIAKYLSDPDFIDKVEEYARNFKNKYHNPKTIYDGITKKRREIIIPTFYELVIQHMLMTVLIPVFMKGMYEHSYGSIPDRGAHKGKRTIEKWIHRSGKDMKYCLKMDIRKYFDSIHHDILIDKFTKVIRDKELLKIITEIINVKNHGIPLGFYSSQWIANWYLQGLDHYIKEGLHAKYYIRYMDDMVIFGGNKRRLHEIRIKIEEYLHGLGLEMKDNWQLFRFHYLSNGKDEGRFLDFMGFRFYRNRTTLRRNIMLRATRKAKKISKKDKPTIYDIRQILSYMGWFKSTDSRGLYESKIKPFVDIKKSRHRISVYDKRLA